MLNARPDLAEPLRAALRPELGDDPQARLDALAADDPAALGALQLVIVGGYYTDRDVREPHRLPGPGGADDPVLGIPRLPRGRPDRRRAGPRPGLARSRDRAARDRPERTPDLRGALRRGRGGRRRTRWPRRRLSTRHPRRPAGSTRSSPTGAPAPARRSEIREPASGRPLLTLPQSTPDDVARAAAAAAAAQPAWADTSYAERAAILRRAADIYEAHRPEFGTWTQRETGAVHSKMFHEANFAAGELHAAATMPFQPYGQLVPSVVPGRLSMLRRVPAGVIGAITPWNSPSVLGMRIVAPALAVGQRRRSSSPTRRRPCAAARCSRRCSGRPGCPRACSTSSSAARTSARRSSPTPT